GPHTVEVLLGPGHALRFRAPRTEAVVPPFPPSVGDKGSFLCHVDRPRNASTGPVEGGSDQARALRTASRTAGTTSAAKISTCCADSPAGPMTNVSIPYSTANSVICSTHLSTGP